MFPSLCFQEILHPDLIKGYKENQKKEKSSFIYMDSTTLLSQKLGKAETWGKHPVNWFLVIWFNDGERYTRLDTSTLLLSPDSGNRVRPSNWRNQDSGR